MPDVALPESLATEIAELTRRVRVLETAPRANDTTMPWTFSLVDTLESTTAVGAAVNLTTVGPEVTVTVGQSGRVFVNAGAYISPLYGGLGAVHLYIDGAYSFELLKLGQDPTSQVYSNLATTRVMTGISAGSHTFTMKYVSNGIAASFAARFLTVQPF